MANMTFSYCLPINLSRKKLNIISTEMVATMCIYSIGMKSLVDDV
jgi:hypothetical protein